MAHGHGENCACTVHERNIMRVAACGRVNMQMPHDTQTIPRTAYAVHSRTPHAMYGV